MRCLLFQGSGCDLTPTAPLGEVVWSLRSPTGRPPLSGPIPVTRLFGIAQVAGPAVALGHIQADVQAFGMGRSHAVGKMMVLLKSMLGSSMLRKSRRQ